VKFVTMAFRNIFRQRRRSFLTALTMVCAFWLTSFSIAFNLGSYGDIIETFTRKSYGQVKVHESTYLASQSLYKTVHNADSLLRVLDFVPLVSAAAPRLYTGALFSVGNRTTFGSLVGIDPVREEKAFGFNRHVTVGNPLTPNSNSVLVGSGVLKTLNASVGDTLFVLTQGADGSMANELFPIGGVVSSGNNQADRSTVYLRLNAMQELLVLENQVHEIALLSDLKNGARKLADQVAPILPEQTTAFTWQEFLSSFYRAMQADQKGGYISLVIIMVIAAGGILNTVLMAVLERRREYGLLKALGTTPIQLFSLVMIEMIFLSFLSVGVGMLFAVPTNLWFSIKGMTLPEPMTYGGMSFTTMHAEMNLAAFLIPGIVVLFTTVVVTLWPAIMASQTTPAESLRKN